MSEVASLPAVLITGGAARLGGEMTKRFADAGWHIVIHYRESDEEAEALAATLPSAETVQCDLADPNAALALACDLAERLPNWRCLINSAAVFRYDDVTGIDVEANREAMQVNAVSPAIIAQAFLANATGKAPRVAIQFTDMKLENPNPDFFSYTMSKHAAASTIEMLAMTAPDDARVYGIAPGAILASHDQSEEETEVSHRMNLLERRTGADEISGAALYLATGHLRSGSTLYIDSGQHLLSQPRDVIYLAREQQEGTA